MSRINEQGEDVSGQVIGEVYGVRAITQYTHKLIQNGAVVRYLKMSDRNARKLLAEESRYFNGLSLVKGPLKYDTRKNGIVER